MLKAVLLAHCSVAVMGWRKAERSAARWVANWVLLMVVQKVDLTAVRLVHQLVEWRVWSSVACWV